MQGRGRTDDSIVPEWSIKDVKTRQSIGAGITVLQALSADHGETHAFGGATRAGRVPQQEGRRSRRRAPLRRIIRQDDRRCIGSPHDRRGHRRRHRKVLSATLTRIRVLGPAGTGMEDALRRKITVFAFTYTLNVFS